MAWIDYKICDLCGNAKVFYDANIEDERYRATWGEPSDYDPIGLKAICGDCNKTHQVVVAPRADLCADPALLAEAVEVLRNVAAINTLSGREHIVSARDAARAFIAKMENRHDR